MRTVTGYKGHQLRFLHQRFPTEPKPTPTNDRHLMHGCTTCEIIDKDEKVVATGQACCSVNDCYTKESGRKLALSRALTNGSFSREDRAGFWKAYFRRLPVDRRPQPKGGTKVVSINVDIHYVNPITHYLRKFFSFLRTNSKCCHSQQSS